MLDYIFHYPDSLTRFTRFLDSRRIPYQSRDDALGLVVAIAEDLDDAIVDAVESCYDTLLQEQEALSSTRDGEAAGKTTTALSVQLSGGQTVYASIPAEVMRRLLSVLSPEEIGRLVDAIASAVENPDPRPICKR